MILDYKDVSFSFKRKKVEKLKKRIKLIIFLTLLVISIILIKYFIENTEIISINNYLLDNKVNKAFDKINNSSLLFFKKELYELRALANIYEKNLIKAKKIFKKILKSKINHLKHINLMIDRALYIELKIYLDFLSKNKINVNTYYSIYYLSQFNKNKAKEYFKKSENKKINLVLQEILKDLEDNNINYIFDINDKPIAYYDILKKKTEPIIKGFSFTEFNNEIKNGLKFFKLTIDSDIQNKVHKLFNKFNGNLIILKIPENSIIASYSKTQGKPNSVFNLQYEPGSIIKVLSLFSYLSSDKKDLFPFKCKGLLTLNNKTFYDWMKHDLIKTPEQALAVSCNTAHALMGIRSGYKRYTEILDKFYFNHEPIYDNFLRFDFGKFDGNKKDDFSLADLSVGLNIISTTTFHSAFISSIIAQSGLINTPYIIKNQKNILKIAFYNIKKKEISVFNKNPNYLKIKKAMEEVVYNKKGTGRRARVYFVKIAIKTGTAGDKKFGLDSIIMGFFPSDNPEYAFAFWLHGAGKAEFKGAYFLKDFLKELYNR